MVRVIHCWLLLEKCDNWWGKEKSGITGSVSGVIRFEIWSLNHISYSSFLKVRFSNPESSSPKYGIIPITNVHPYIRDQEYEILISEYGVFMPAFGIWTFEDRSLNLVSGFQNALSLNSGTWLLHKFKIKIFILELGGLDLYIWNLDWLSSGLDAWTWHRDPWILDLDSWIRDLEYCIWDLHCRIQDHDPDIGDLNT